MARSRGSTRRRGGSSPNAPRPQPAPAAYPLDDFDQAWLGRVRERFDARYIDLTSIEDRRLWHPSKQWPRGPVPRGIYKNPRIVIVPEGHKLSRYATYNQKYKLGQLYGRRPEYRLQRQWEKQSVTDKHGGKYQSTSLTHRLSPRIGFHHPWQVIICVRRKRRRETLFALNLARKGNGKGKKQRRTEYSEVRC